MVEDGWNGRDEDYPGIDLGPKADAPSLRNGVYFRAFPNTIQSIPYRSMSADAKSTYNELCAWVCAEVNKTKPMRFSDGAIPHWRDWKHICDLGSKKRDAAEQQCEEMIRAGLVEENAAETYFLTEWWDRQYTNHPSAMKQMQRDRTRKLTGSD
jgi:hypothetical protein